MTLWVCAMAFRFPLDRLLRSARSWVNKSLVPSLVPILCKLTGPVQFHGNFHWPLYRLIISFCRRSCWQDAKFRGNVSRSCVVNAQIKVVGQSFDYLRFKWFVQHLSFFGEFQIVPTTNIACNCETYLWFSSPLLKWAHDPAYLMPSEMYT